MVTESQRSIYETKTNCQPIQSFSSGTVFTILFFSVASAVCVQIFVKSHTLSTQAHDLTQASRRAGDVAELITASTSPDDMKNLLEDAYSDAVNIASENFTIFYDSDFYSLFSGNSCLAAIRHLESERTASGCAAGCHKTDIRS